MPIRTIVYDPNEPVVIRGYAFEYEVELARVLLEAHDIPALLIRDACAGLGAGTVRLAVRQEDAAAALSALESPDASVEGDEDEIEPPAT